MTRETFIMRLIEYATVFAFWGVIALVALCILCGGCTHVAVTFPDGSRGQYTTCLKDVSLTGATFRKLPDGSIELSIPQYQSTETKALETANAALNLAAKVVP